jgi:hypothetical protein
MAPQGAVGKRAFGEFGPQLVQRGSRPETVVGGRPRALLNRHEVQGEHRQDDRRGCNRRSQSFRGGHRARLEGRVVAPAGFEPCFGLRGRQAPARYDAAPRRRRANRGRGNKSDLPAPSSQRFVIGYLALCSRRFMRDYSPGGATSPIFRVRARGGAGRVRATARRRREPNEEALIQAMRAPVVVQQSEVAVRRARVSGRSVHGEREPHGVSFGRPRTLS